MKRVVQLILNLKTVHQIMPKAHYCSIRRMALSSRGETMPVDVSREAQLNAKVANHSMT